MPDDYAGVGQVEYRPPADVDEVDDGADAQAVYQVAEGASELHPYGEAQQAAGQRLGPVEVEEEADGEERGDYQERGLVLEEAEGRAGVRAVREANYALVGPGVVEGQVGPDKVLACLVEGQHGEHGGRQQAVPVPDDAPGRRFAGGGDFAHCGGRVLLGGAFHVRTGFP